MRAVRLNVGAGADSSKSRRAEGRGAAMLRKRRLLSGLTCARAKVDNQQDNEDRRPDYGQNPRFRFLDKGAYGVVFLVSVWSVNHDFGVISIELRRISLNLKNQRVLKALLGVESTNHPLHWV